MCLKLIVYVGNGSCVKELVFRGVQVPSLEGEKEIGE